MHIEKIIGLWVRVIKYNSKPGSTQCYNCQRYNHTQRACHNEPRCVRCAQNHRSHLCPFKGTQNYDAVCALCHGPHPASSITCPRRPGNNQQNSTNTANPITINYSAMKNIEANPTRSNNQVNAPQTENKPRDSTDQSGNVNTYSAALKKTTKQQQNKQNNNPTPKNNECNRPTGTRERTEENLNQFIMFMSSIYELYDDFCKASNTTEKMMVAFEALKIYDSINQDQ
ncbi:uncharacterized protein LOC118201095 [Stegodyphus dumicola]|uniref:uncharacterized protein LOC118201095 n=1 Tax=Stegodyphus dumicola TaxID=202533 RepID=UPI0015B0BFD1|nr:uncharacterized protein LOC118201095 [Stegodyphus dumicola]